MPSKSLKATVNMTAEQVEDAIVYLSDRYLKANKTTCRVVQTPNEFCLLDICKPLVEMWVAGKVNYAKGTVTLLFRSGELSEEADLVIYAPVKGDRFLYTTPRPFEEQNDHLSLPFEDDINSNTRDSAEFPVHSLQDVINRQAVLEEKLDQLLTAYSPSTSNADQESAQPTSPGSQTAPNPPPLTADFLDTVTQHIKERVTQQIRDNLTAAFTPLHQQIGELQEQLSELSDRIDDLENLSLESDPPIPQTDEEWLDRIEQTWGTVGDYERYNASYREANAATPLFETPDWVALCELEWARELCPALAALYTLIHSPEGIGYEGADVLQQFGQHIDPKTGDPYYIYRYNGFTPFEALQQIAYNAEHSWLPEINHLWRRLGHSNHDIFYMFGWEEEAIAALKAIATQSQYNQRSSGYSWDYQQTWQDSSPTTPLKEYQAILNLGPFTPITLEGVKRAYRTAMKAAHPDTGGSNEHAQRVNEAYAAVMRHYFPEAT